MPRPAGTAAFALALLVAACTPSPAPDDARARFAAWRAPHAAEIAALQAHLTAHGVGDVMPPEALLRTSRRWRACGPPEFAVPPRALWGRIVPTLRVVRELRDAGVLDPALGRSAWRSAEVNACAGGSTRSRHLTFEAFDFDLADGTRVEVLCDYWRTRGPSRRLGLGFYAPTLIHLDTTGHRTWGNDHHRGTSLCVAPAGAAVSASAGTAAGRAGGR